MKKNLYLLWLILFCITLETSQASSIWVETTKLTAFDGTPYDQFGWSVATDGNFAVIGSPYSDFQADKSGSVYIYHREGENWILNNKIIPSDGVTYEEFGVDVGISGDFIVVGTGYLYGTYIFKKQIDLWIEQTKLFRPGASAFGFHTAISGNYILVTDFGDNSYTGAAYIYKLVDSSWIEQCKIIAEDHQRENAFGTRAAIDGNHAIIGVHNNRSSYIFKRSDDPNDKNWYQEKKLVPLDANGGGFGVAVSISGDFALIGASADNDKGYCAGSAYIFKRIGNDWLEQQKLFAPDAHEKHYFGRHASISGNYAAISAWGDYDLGIEAGAVYIFEYDGSSWNFAQKLLASDGAAGDQLGPVSINGNYLLAAAPLDNVESGSAYVFKLVSCPLEDLNNDCWIDFADYSIFAERWTLPDAGGVVDLSDLAALLNNWLIVPE